jgi:hypothetical protein
VALARIAANARSVLTQRMNLAARRGITFDGDRDMYAVVGYPKDTPEFADMWAMYEREDIASTIIDFEPQETWRDVPTVKDGEEKDAEEDTPFEFEWRRLSKRLDFWQNCEKADKLAGFGYSAMVIGVAGSGDLSSEIRKTTADSILYLRPFSMDNAPIEAIEDDVSNPRFGLPKLYRINFGTNGQAKETFVHASRVLHIAENALENSIYGQARLLNVWNLLLALQKVVHGSAEATWKLIRKGFLLNIDPDVTIPADFLTRMEEQLDEFEHDMRRNMTTKGLTATDLGSEVVDPSGLSNLIISLIAATRRIPQRTLMGSELGRLAADQDARAWSGRVARRRTLYAEKQFIDEFIRRLLSWGALPPPQAGEWSVFWQPLYEMSQEEQATVAVAWATAFEKMAGQMGQPILSMSEYREMFTPLPTAVPPGLKPIPAPKVPDSVPEGGESDQSSPEAE